MFFQILVVVVGKEKEHEANWKFLVTGILQAARQKMGDRRRMYY